MPHHGRCAPSAVPRTATDGPRRRRVSGLMRAAESGVHPRVSGRGPGRFPGRGAGGEGGCAGGQGGCPGERDGGRAGGAGAGCRAFTAGVLGPGHPCGDDAVLLGAVREQCPAQRLGHSLGEHSAHLPAATRYRVCRMADPLTLIRGDAHGRSPGRRQRGPGRGH